MTGAERRKMILNLMKESTKPLSGGALGTATGVSRQVVVQDITLLRTAYPILATAKGYLLYPATEKKCRRTYCVKHTIEETRDELNAIVDLGGKVLDVMVEHDIYGEIRADLMLSRRKEVEEFCNQLDKSKSGPLNIIGCGVHYHTVEAENETILDEIAKSLDLYSI